MKKFLIGLLFFICSTVLMAQSEPYERYVGAGHLKYPMTVVGLQRAIASLPNSGAVYISYPGLSDTSGLGVVPSNIHLTGWYQGSLISSAALTFSYTNTEIDSAVGQFIGESFTRYVGMADKKYPLTVTGLQNAIASLDSGIVYIAHPGLWDTTGLGTMPDNITLSGWLWGNLYTFLSNDGETLNQTNGQDIFINRRRSHNWWGAMTNENYLSTEIFIDAGETNYQMLGQVNRIFITMDSLVYNERSTPSQNGVYFYPTNVATIGGNASLVGSENFIFFSSDITATIPNVTMNSNVMDWVPIGVSGALFNGAANLTITNVYGYKNSGGSWSTPGTIGTVYHFYADGTSFAASGTPTQYLFYGKGDYPSWFGGDVRTAGSYYGATITNGTNIDIDDANKTISLTADTVLINGVRKYVALLTQSNTNAPVATVLENSLGATVVWSYLSAGGYLFTCTGKFTSNKSIWWTGNFSQGVNNYEITGGFIDGNYGAVIVTNELAEGSNNILSNTLFIIEVYP